MSDVSEAGRAIMSCAPRPFAININGVCSWAGVQIPLRGIITRALGEHEEHCREGPCARWVL